MTTDNRTNEPSEAQVEAAAKAIADCHNPGMFEKYPENWRVEARAALEAAAGVAPPAPTEYAYCPIHGDLLAANRSYRCGNAPTGHEYAAPVRPSSTVDEDSVRLDVVRMAKNVYDRYKSELPIHNEVQAEIEEYAGDYPPKNIND